MFNIFRRKKIPEVEPHPAIDKAVSIIGKSWLKAQTTWANWLSEHERKMNQQQKKIGLAVLVVLMFALPGAILYNGFFKKTTPSQGWLKPPTVTLPEDTRLPDSLNVNLLKELYRKRHLGTQQIDSTHN